jgi:hypothetical protein
MYVLRPSKATSTEAGASISPHLLGQRPNERLVPAGTQHVTQLQFRRNQNSHRQPLNCLHPLQLDMIALDMLAFQMPLLHKLLMHLLPISPACSSHALTVRSSSPNAATMACTGQPFCFSYPVQRRPLSFVERLLAHLTLVASPLLAMNADLTRSYFPSSDAVLVGVNLFLGFHGSTSLFTKKSVP